MAITVTHNRVTGAAANADALVDGPAWDEAHVVAGGLEASEITSGQALSRTNDTNITLTLGGDHATALLKATSLTMGWAGTLSVARGGTGISSLGTGVATALGINVGSAGAFVTFNGALGTPSTGTLTNATGLPLSTGITGAGTGVLTALAVNVGSAGAPVLFNGAGGTPSSLTLTNATGLPVGSVTGLGTGVGTFLATPSSANLRSALTDETGTGGAVFATAPTLAQPVIQGITNGTPPIAGQVGQLISSTVSIGAGVALTSGAAGIVWNDIDLTAGIWLVGGNCGAVVTGGLLAHIHADHSTGTTLTTSPAGGATMAAHVDANQANGVIWPLGCRTYDLSGNTTISSVITTDFSAGTAVAYGHLWGIRIA